MFRLLVILCAGLGLVNAFAQDTSPAAFRGDLQRTRLTGAHRSLSGQFIVRVAPPTGWRPLSNVATNPALVRLDPNYLVVSCERIKKSLLNELGASDAWRGRIYLTLNPTQSPDDTLVVTAAQYNQDWVYHLALPGQIESPRLISAVVEVLLLEMANRHATGRSAEIPVWLSHGLSQQIMRTSDIELVLKPPTQTHSGLNLDRTTWSGYKADALSQAHEELSNQPPLTLEQLSWATDDQYAGFAGQSARGSAQFFVYELTQLPGGRDCLRAFVEKLPAHLNWQLAFLEAFHQHFASQLQLEKWWSLHLVNFIGRDLAQTWPGDESWRKLNEVIRPPVEVRTSANGAPTRTDVTLQNIIRNWSLMDQTPVLQGKIHQLLLLRMRISQDLIPLADAYRQALKDYLDNLGKGRTMMSLTLIDKDTCRDLDRLDGLLEKYRPRTEPDNQARNDAATVLVSH